MFGNLTLKKRIKIYLVLIFATIVISINFEWQHDARYTSQVSSFHMNSVQLVTEEKIMEPVTNRIEYKQFGSFIAIPNFYIKHGHYNDNGDNLLTLCSICSSDLVSQAQKLATNYKSGPLSFAIYIDKDIHSHTINAQTHLLSLFDAYFGSLWAPYDIYIGLVYVNTSSPFWIHLGYTNHTEMGWKIPVNAMRNLAEYQVTTRWLLTVDVDFELYSFTMNSPHHINTILSNMQDASYADHTVFIMPSFAMNASYLDGQMDYNNLTRNELLSLISTQQIEPFYDKQPAQNCTDYPQWYAMETYYQINLHDIRSCRKHYEPFYILKTEVSTRYGWDSRFTGRHLDKIQRMQRLRYHDFTAIVMTDVFMIHVNREHVTNVSILDYVALNNKLLRKAPYFIK